MGAGDEGRRGREQLGEKTTTDGAAGEDEDDIGVRLTTTRTITPRSCYNALEDTL